MARAVTFTLGCGRLRTTRFIETVASLVALYGSDGMRLGSLINDVGLGNLGNSGIQMT